MTELSDESADGTGRFTMCVSISKKLEARTAVYKFSVIRQLVDWLCSFIFIYHWANRKVVFSIARTRPLRGCIHHSSSLTAFTQKDTHGNKRP
jgi:hypothetical protein